jgi:DNA-directed RNA polymerase subunit RPC12/RpoP
MENTSVKSREVCKGCGTIVGVTRENVGDDPVTLLTTVEEHNRNDGTPCVLAYKCPKCEAMIWQQGSTGGYLGPDCPKCRGKLERIFHLTAPP